MKLSNDAISVLKNFSSINESIFVNKGNTLQTISKQKNILAEAKVPDNFTDEFGIYDVNNFLGLMSLTSSEIDFEPKNLIIKALDGRSVIRYRKAAKETIVVPPDKKVNMDKAEISLELTASDLVWITKVASTLGSPNLVFSSDGTDVFVEAFDAKDDSAHVNTTKICAGNGKKYRMIFNKDNLRFIPGAYSISIKSSGVGHFKNKDFPVEYWITTEAGSKYEG